MASSRERPQFYANNLQPVKIDKTRLIEVLAHIRAAIRQGVDLIESSYPPPDCTEKDAFGSICSGHLGIALTYLRLEYQSFYLRAEEDGSVLPDFRRLAHARMNSHHLKLDIQPGRPSLMSSAALGAAFMRIIGHSPKSEPVRGDDARNPHEKDDVGILHDVVHLALQQSHVVLFRGHCMGGDEVMTGRAGLLWALSNIQHHLLDDKSSSELNALFGALPNLVDAIMEAGRIGAEEYITKNGDANALPLMWLWFDGLYGLGAMHGSAGVLAILLTIITTSPVDSPIRTHLPQIAQTIIALGKLCVSHQGHLPMSIPEILSNTTRVSPLVQICHGTPGLLYLLAQARNNGEFLKTDWVPECDEAIRLGSEKVWEEGLLSKGGGLCHGIAGNAWAWLVLHDAFEYCMDPKWSGRENSTKKADDVPAAATNTTMGDHFLSKALAFLLQAIKTQPLSTDSDEYRMPDKPYGLYEGLAGTICAWAEACVVLVARLRKMEMDEEGGERGWSEDECLKKHLSHQLGFPTLG